MKIKQAKFFEGVLDPRSVSGHIQEVQSDGKTLEVSFDETTFIVTLRALQNGKTDPTRGEVLVPPTNIRSIRKFPATTEKTLKSA